MIYNLDHYFLFVHIPRTGGMSITHAIFEALPKSYVNLLEWRHRYAMHIQRIEEIENHFYTMYKFAIVRNPWDIVESDYSLTLKDIHQPTFLSRIGASGHWLQRLDRVSRYSGFDEFVFKEYLEDVSPVLEGGFYHTWCCGPEGQKIGVQPILFQELDQRWPDICGVIGIPEGTLPHDNHVERAECVWSPSSRDAIADLCHRDLEEFNFDFNGTLCS